MRFWTSSPQNGSTTLTHLPLPPNHSHRQAAPPPPLTSSVAYFGAAWSAKSRASVVTRGQGRSNPSLISHSSFPTAFTTSTTEVMTSEAALNHEHLQDGTVTSVIVTCRKCCRSSRPKRSWTDTCTCATSATVSAFKVHLKCNIFVHKEIKYLFVYIQVVADPHRRNL